MSVSIEVVLWPKRDSDKVVRAGYVKIGGMAQINISVMETNGRYWISYPSYKKADGTWQETAGPLNKEARDFILDCVISEMNKSGSGGSSSKPAAPKKEETKSDPAQREETGSMETPW